jgi:hypothetical protein
MKSPAKNRHFVSALLSLVAARACGWLAVRASTAQAIAH